MDGYIQTGLGILVSLVLFVIGYRQTIGAKKERARNANLSIHRAILRRMVLEEYAPVYSDITRLIEGKAREFQVSINDLWSEDQVLNSLFTEVFDSDLISPSQRVEIEKRLNGCLDKAEKESSKPSFAEYQQIKLERKSTKDSLSAMVLSASILGALASVLFKFVETKTIQVEWIFSALGVLVLSIAVLSVYRKTKETETVSSRRTEFLHDSEFETEIAKILAKSGHAFIIEPRLGNLTPDFLVEINGKKVAIEAKAWDGPVPLHFVRRTQDYLQQLLASEKIDKAILVTRKQTAMPLGNLGNEKIVVTTIDQLSKVLKEAA
ncbi:MAG: restriction endonuclease [Chlorobiaceae bacterium]|nr:restriction endonuclease [Chlorobiaceae bacterium]